jgi:hypothetical protein
VAQLSRYENRTFVPCRKQAERIYSCEFGVDDESVAIELEFESMEHRRACWGKWFKQPEAHEATARMRALIRSGGVHQVWRLH